MPEAFEEAGNLFGGDVVLTPDVKAAATSSPLTAAAETSAPPTRNGTSEGPVKTTEAETTEGKSAVRTRKRKGASVATAKAAATSSPLTAAAETSASPTRLDTDERAKAAATSSPLTAAAETSAPPTRPNIDERAGQTVEAAPASETQRTGVCYRDAPCNWCGAKRVIRTSSYIDGDFWMCRDCREMEEIDEPTDEPRQVVVSFDWLDLKVLRSSQEKRGLPANKTLLCADVDGEK